MWLMAGVASAHVTVHGPEATQGGFAKITFQVPTERDVPTTKLTVQFPADHPLAFVSVKPHPGWTYKVTQRKLDQPITVFGSKIKSVVGQIAWTATGPGIKPGEFDDFDVSIGPIPEVDSLTFKALQTYSNGEVVRWIEPTVAGQQEPEHPAPVLKVAPATEEPSTSTPGTTAEADDAGDGSGLAVAALIVAIVAALLAGGALVRGRSSA
jgi:uncharacterized protein YcnI